MTASERNIPDGRHGEDHEPRDVSPRFVVFVLLGLLAGIVGSAALVGGLIAILSAIRHEPPATAIEAAPREAPGPRLQVRPAADLAANVAAAQRKIDGYGWADRAAERVRVPIGRAMDLLVQQGWPDGNERGEPQ